MPDDKGEPRNTAYCQSSGKWFTMLEAYALKKKIIRCIDGRDKGESFKKVLGGELFTQTLEEFKQEYDVNRYNDLLNQLNIRKSVELPGNGKLMGSFCDELADIYKSRNTIFFRPASRDVVEISRIKHEDKYIENGFVIVNPNRFITMAEMLIKPWTTIFTSNGPKFVDKSMNASMANVVLASPNLQNKLPHISRIFDVPIPILHNGVLTFPKKGFDVRFSSWLPFNSPKIEELSL